MGNLRNRLCRCTVIWELRQWKRSRLTLRQYISVKAWDTVADLLAGNLAFIYPHDNYLVWEQALISLRK
jgi:hypothetical protein